MTLTNEELPTVWEQARKAFGTLEWALERSEMIEGRAMDTAALAEVGAFSLDTALRKILATDDLDAAKEIARAALIATPDWDYRKVARSYAEYEGDFARDDGIKWGEHLLRAVNNIRDCAGWREWDNLHVVVENYLSATGGPV